MRYFRARDYSAPCVHTGRPDARGAGMDRLCGRCADSRSSPLWVVRLLLVVGLLVAAHSPGFPVGDDPETRHTLGGQRGGHVVVEPFGPDAKPDQLTRAQLRTDVEQWLRAAGIPVFTAEQAAKQLGKPALHVRVTWTRDTRHRLYAVHISVEFQQVVALVRNAAVRVLAPTWRAEGVGTVAADHLQTIRQDLRNYVEDFIGDYLIMSPPAPAELAVPSPDDERPRSPGDKP